MTTPASQPASEARDPTPAPSTTNRITFMSSTELSSPPLTYDPGRVERTVSHTLSEPPTAVNSPVLEDGLSMHDTRFTRLSELYPMDERKTPAGQLPIIVRPFSAKMREHLMAEVDTNLASYPLAGFCFMTGYVDAVTYTAAYVWSAFQTGNTIQCAMAIAKLFTKFPHAVIENPPPTTVPEEVSWNPLAAAQWDWRRDTGFTTSDAQALASLLAFLAGAFVGRLGDRIGPRKRVWLIAGTFLQALFTLASSLTCWADGESSFGSSRGSGFTNWGTVLGFCTLCFASASMGLQAHTGVRIGNVFNSTVVLTTIWVQLVGEPKLFRPRLVKQRDHKAIAILGLIIGGIAGRALVNKIGAAWTLGLGFIIRILVAFSWLTIPAAKK